ncbi:MAG TPA: VTT domain-containing protein [Gammaproteobacteria bacterium]
MDAERVDAKRAKPGSANVYGVCTWAAFVAVCLSFYLFAPELFDPRRLRELFAGNLETGLLVYFVIATLRGFTFIPLTPILLAGVLVFPPLPLFLVNQAAVGTSSAIVYGMARIVGSDRFARNHYPEQVERLAGLLEKRELPVIGLWGAAPFTPSDLIVYVCSVLRISLWKTLLGISIGEGLVCAIYIFGGASVLEAALDLFGR